MLAVAVDFPSDILLSVNGDALRISDNRVSLIPASLKAARISGVLFDEVEAIATDTSSTL